MPFSPGEKLGQYDVLGPIGKGGMGEVYRARDTRLKREVAIKALPAAFTSDPGRMMRFQREAEVLASLDHPNIGAIYGLVEEGTQLALVLALIDGPTLDERIKQGPLPPDEAISVAQQIIAALEYVHDRGVIHRDLKPANVKITPDGVVKVLDFGLAKVLEDERPSTPAADSPTLTLGHTLAGTILGTAAYMSPEQAVGKTADRRSDIFSFGAVLYEMLMGQRAFHGESGPEILVAVAKDEPDWSKLPPATPRVLRDVLKRCLTKDRKQRLQAIGEARILLSNPPDDAPVAPPPAAGRSRLALAGWIAAVLATAGALVAWYRPAPVEQHPLIHFTTKRPLGSLEAYPLVFSPDGSKMAFVDGPAAVIYLRTLDNPDAKPLAGTEGASFPTFSPGGDWIAFFSGGQIRKVPVAGGTAVTVPDISLAQLLPMDWGSDDFIYFSTGKGIERVPAQGGKVELVAKLDPGQGEVQYVSPQSLPGGDYVLIKVLTRAGLSDLRIIAINPHTGDKKIVFEHAGDARFVPSGFAPGVGHLVYSRNGTLFATPFDARTLKAGSPVPMMDGLVGGAGLGVFGVSNTGTLAYQSGNAQDFNTSSPIWVNRQGVEQAISLPARWYQKLRVSPDGRRIAAQVLDLSKGLAIDLWIFDTDRQTFSKITFDGVNGYFSWTADGKRLIHATEETLGASRFLVRSSAVDSSDQPMILWKDAPVFMPSSQARDGVVIGNVALGTNPGNQLLTLKLDPGGTSASGKLESFLDDRFLRTEPQFSPDGKWVAFQSNQTGANEIYVVSYPGPGGLVQVSSGGGTQPRWNRNGRELFFRNGDKLMAADVETTGSSFRANAPVELFTKPSFDYDVSADGRQFLMLKAALAAEQDQRTTTELHLIVNWFDELRRRAPLP